MTNLMRCQYCGVLQDEPKGAKLCALCGGELQFVASPPPSEKDSYIQVQLELDQVKAPAGQNLERYLLVTLCAPKQVPATQVAQTASGRSALNFTIVLDNSGSMFGEKLSHAKQAVRQALNRLLDGDVLSLIIFSSDVRCVLEPTTLKVQTRKVLESALDEISATGMTALCSGLELGINKALIKKMDNSLLLLLSDGQANIGETDLEKVGQRGTQARQKGLTVSTLGVGSDYNEALLAEIASQGGGRFYHVQQAGEISAYLTGELGELANLAGRDVKIHLEVPDGVVVTPLSTAYPIQQQASDVILTVGDLPCDTELEIPLRIAVPSQPETKRLSFEGWVDYHSPANSLLKSSLKRVTLRFVDLPEFQLRDGVAKPVVERVIEHVKAVSILGYSRAMSQGDNEGNRVAVMEKERLQAYALLLGEERARKELREIDAVFISMQTPLAAKQAVSSAYAFSRAAKQFTKKDSS